MEKSSGVVDLTSPSPSPSVIMTSPKGSATYISAAFNPLGYLHRIPSLTFSSFVHGQGRTSSSVPDLIGDYEHWTYVCDSCFFLAMAEWNVDGDGESLIISTHIIDWWRPRPRSTFARRRLPLTPRLFFATPLRQFSVSSSYVLYCSCMLLWHCRGPRHLSVSPLFFILFITLVLI
jgi:hypothetical protein